jgi:predicted O-methyltransferase YrrM
MMFSMLQQPTEWRDFCDLLRTLDPHIKALEIGTGPGGTAESLGAIFEGYIVSVDLPSAASTGMSRSACIERNAGLRRIHPHFRGILGDSHQTAAYAQVKQFVGEHGLFDLAFIDGDHTREGVRQDHHMYAPFVRPGGVIAFHDIASIKFIPMGCEVPLYWDEIKGLHRTTEFCCGGDFGGIGVIHVPAVAH